MGKKFNLRNLGYGEYIGEFSNSPKIDPRYIIDREIDLKDFPKSII